MSEHDVVPTKLKDTINYKILVAILVGVIVFHSMVNLVLDEDIANFAASGLTMSVYFSVGIASFLVVKHHYGTKVFRRAYAALAIAYLAMFMAEVIYFVYDNVLLLDPYPSPADPFYFALYPFTIVHLILNIRFFKPKIHHAEKNTIYPVTYRNHISICFTILARIRRT